jgi:hypothetical protein
MKTPHSRTILAHSVTLQRIVIPLSVGIALLAAYLTIARL